MPRDRPKIDISKGMFNKPSNSNTQLHVVSNASNMKSAPSTSAKPASSFKLLQSSAGSNTKSSSIQCFRCQRCGHYTRECLNVKSMIVTETGYDSETEPISCDDNNTKNESDLMINVLVRVKFL